MAVSIREYLERGPSTSKEIQAATGLSQSSVVRYLNRMGESVVPLQKGRSVKYAATCNAFGSSDKLPIGLIDEHGSTDLVAYLRPLIHGGFFVEPVKEISPLLLGEGQNGLYDDLPYFLYDVRPQGFLGRQIAQKIALQSEFFPSNPKRWTSNHIGRYLISNGEDLPGNIIFGEQALLRVQRKPIPSSEEHYPALADSVMNGEVPGSSAGGEQPKFTTYNEELSSHVIVKFSPKGNNELSERWRDVLITEHHAANSLNNNFFPAATSRLFEMDDRLFLETTRLDRTSNFGRSSMISLEAIDAEYVGLGNTWPQVMTELFKIDRVDVQDVFYAEALWLFGQFINNTDMHLGNLSLSIERDQFKLLPIYDMCSMGFSPKSGGEVMPFAFWKPNYHSYDSLNNKKTLLNKEHVDNIKSIAHEFWENVTNDNRISDGFRSFLQHSNPIEMLINEPSTDFSP